MSTQQTLETLISNAPEDKLNIILAFAKFVLLEDTDINNSFSLALPPFCDIVKVIS